MSFTEIVAVVRDITFLSVLVIGLVAVLYLVFKAKSVLNSAQRTIRNTEEITSTISSRIVRPAAAGSGVAYGAGKVIAFLGGLRGKKKGRRKGGDKDG